MYGGISIFTGNANPGFAAAICDHIGLPLGRADVFEFSPQEGTGKIEVEVRKGSAVIDRIELHFLRDREKREVDFLVAVDRKPWFAVEVKKGKDRASSSLRYFAERLHIPYLYQVVWDQTESLTRDGVFVMSPAEFLSAFR